MSKMVCRPSTTRETKHTPNFQKSDRYTTHPAYLARHYRLVVHLTRIPPSPISNSKCFRLSWTPMTTPRSAFHIYEASLVHSGHPTPRPDSIYCNIDIHFDHPHSRFLLLCRPYNTSFISHPMLHLGCLKPLT
ncbi:unnamed protein product [Cuscuta epithymum]|uniref:Uncharacterized protein n=1 Tax=Cuscuta epithymum TaxID=186058 RepID=A0AAV0F9W2_9ASTE|nr:unnamed protein product [Cuscuta epithymum]